MSLAFVMAFAAWKPTITAFESDRDDVESGVVMRASCLIIDRTAVDLDVMYDAHRQRTLAVMVISFVFGG